MPGDLRGFVACLKITDVRLFLHTIFHDGDKVRSFFDNLEDNGYSNELQLF